ncbi:MAG: hypothetical protein ACYTFT_06140, partial [Planctomycetota bacterium]
MRYIVFLAALGGLVVASNVSAQGRFEPQGRQQEQDRPTAAGNPVLAEVDAPAPAPTESAPLESLENPGDASADGGSDSALQGGVTLEPFAGELSYQDDGGLPWIRLGGVLDLQAIAYDDRNTRDDRFRIDRGTVRVGGEALRGLTFYGAIDFKGIDTRYGVEEAWVSYEAWRWLRATAGILKIPLGIEHSLLRERLPFTGYAFPAYLNGRTDVAARLDGELFEGVVSYDLTAAVGEGFDLFGQRRGDPQLAGRVVTYPLRHVDLTLDLLYELPLVSGLFFAGGYSYSPGYDGHVEAATPLRNKLFLTRRIEGGRSTFFSLGYGWDLGPFRLIHEWTRGGISEAEIPSGGEVDLDGQITAWALSFAWRITGEPYDSRPYRQRAYDQRPPVPARPVLGLGAKSLDPGDDGAGWGALELALRYENGDIDRDLVLFGFTSFAESSQEFRVLTVALNYEPIAAVKIGAQITRVIADQSPAVFGG